MLTIYTSSRPADCSRQTRRDFLRVGALGLGSFSLADLLAGRAAAASSARKHVADRSVIFLYLADGPSQIETFDPKMDAPAEFRSMSGEVSTCLPGVTFGGDFPRLAAMADRLAIVRSYVPDNANHDSGRSLFGGLTPPKAHWGAVYARLAGTAHPATGMLSNCFVSPMSVGHTAVEKLAGLYYAGIHEVGLLPSSCAPFHPLVAEASGKAAKAKAPREGLLADLTLRIPESRLEDRRNLLAQLDGLQRRLDARDSAVQGLDQYQQQAHQVLLRGMSQAFDLSQEYPRTVAAYDTSMYKTPAACLKRDKNGKMAGHSQAVLGKQLLLARRLCEAGCGFVTVGMNDWDMHGNPNSYSIPEGMPVMGGAVDKAVAALLTDLKERGLADKVLLVMAGEMGRTPRINNDRQTNLPGRDHWASLGALAFAGGGLRMGQVIGASDRTGGKPATEPVTPNQLMATIWHILFDIGELRLVRGLPVELARLVTEGQPIRELVG
jgi:hypothetical protein